MFRLQHAMVAAALIGLTACAPAAPPAVDKTADEAALRATSTTWAAAYNVGDVDKLVPLYAEDGVLMPPNAPVASGPAAIRAFLTKDTAAAKAAGMKMVLGSATTVGISGDLGFESGSYTVTDAAGTAVDSGSYLSTSRRVNGKWLYVRDIYNSDRPLPTPASAPAK